MESGNHQSVKRRQVFYVPGYDPFPPRRYRELYRKESALQAAISGYQIGLAAKPSSETYGWRAASKINGATTVADFEVLSWSDIVRDSMPASILATYWQLLHTSWIYIVSGTLRRLMWMRKGPVIAALYPVGMLLLQLFAGVFVGWFVAAVLEGLLSNLLGLVGWSVAFPWFVTFPIVFVICAIVLRSFKKHDRKTYAYYLMNDYAFSARQKGETPRELTARMAEFEGRIAEALRSDVDEVLIVGHSSGAHIAISVLANLLKSSNLKADGPKLGLLTLGQVIPMVSFLPKAETLRGDLANLSTNGAITWIDVSAPGDGCCFALCDPVAVSGVASHDQKWPVIISAAFSQTLAPDRWQDLKRKYFRLHFQYLCSFDRPKDYDYFQITSGPLSLQDRYRGRASSKSRIDVVASKYTSTT